MLGLKQFSAPQFYIPQLPQTERPLHKAKDMMSFLNSLQWKADEEKAEDDRRGAEAAAAGLDAGLNSGHDTSRRVGSTRWDGMDDSQLWEQAMNSIVTGENPMTEGYGSKVGMTPNGVDYNIFNEEESDKIAPEKRWIGYDPYHRLEAIRASVPGYDPSLMTKVGW